MSVHLVVKGEGDEPVELGDVRIEVAQFAILMERELRKNDWKRSWKESRAWDLFRRIQGETRELHRELTNRRRPEVVGEEAADVANFCMMVADVCGALQ